MNLDRLALFIEVVDAGTLSAASRRVPLSQPAISRNLKLLEEEVGVALFERRGRGLVLTASGRSLVPRARALLDESARVERELRRTAARDYFDLRIGSIDSVVSFLLPQVVTPLKAAFPELALKLWTGRTSDLMRRVEEDELDVAVVAYSGEPPAPRARRVGAYELSFWGRADLFPALSEVAQEAELTRFPLIELESLPGQPTLIAEEALSFAVTYSLASVKSLILGGFGVGGLLDFMLTPAERSRLVRAQVPGDPHCGLYLVSSPLWTGEAAEALEGTLLSALRAAVGGSGRDGEGHGAERA